MPIQQVVVQSLYFIMVYSTVSYHCIILNAHAATNSTTSGGRIEIKMSSSDTARHYTCLLFISSNVFIYAIYM